jgi:hypothetical protein
MNALHIIKTKLNKEQARLRALRAQFIKAQEVTG